MYSLAAVVTMLCAILSFVKNCANRARLRQRPRGWTGPLLHCREKVLTYRLTVASRVQVSEQPSGQEVCRATLPLSVAPRAYIRSIFPDSRYQNLTSRRLLKSARDVAAFWHADLWPLNVPSFICRNLAEFVDLLLTRAGGMQIPHKISPAGH